MKAKVIIGANYGDEGKGLVTAYFSKQARDNNETCLNILTNGGAQRAHTVECLNGRTHIFHHFGSGLWFGADTLFSNEFILNPMEFVREYSELYKTGVPMPHIWVSAECRVSTPFDMILNQELERSRGDNRHGSCGYGIWETINRYRRIQSPCWQQLIEKSYFEIRDYLKYLSTHYIRSMFKEYGISPDLRDYDINGMIDHYIEDVNIMASFTNILSRFPVDMRGTLLKSYDNLIYECGQGLMLSEQKMNIWPHNTPSITGINKKIHSFDLHGDENAEVIYVSRTYLTRHGAGPLPHECDPNWISLGLQDYTNIKNEWQGSLRYAELNPNELYKRIDDDFQNARHCYKKSIFFTHCNIRKPPRIKRGFYKAYYSYSPFCDEDIKVKKTIW